MLGLKQVDASPPLCIHKKRNNLRVLKATISRGVSLRGRVWQQLIKAMGSEVKHFAVGERIVTRWPHQSDYIFNELTGNGVEDRVDQNNFGGLDAVLKVPPGVAAEDAVWAWLWTLSQACYQKSLFRPGETVAVVGLGTLGMVIPPKLLIFQSKSEICP